MSKKGRGDRKQKGDTRQNKRVSRLWPMGVVIAAVGLIAALFFLFPRSEPWGLPAIPRNPRPATLPPELFTGRVAEVYRIAQEVPELLEQMPCYCGCYVSDQHRNNLDCYTDRHSVG